MLAPIARFLKRCCKYTNNKFYPPPLTKFNTRNICFSLPWRKNSVFCASQAVKTLGVKRYDDEALG